MSNKEWLLLDAKDKIVGRLATKVASILIGKNKSDYTPGCDNGEFTLVSIINHIITRNTKETLAFDTNKERNK